MRCRVQRLMPSTPVPAEQLETLASVVLAATRALVGLAARTLADQEELTVLQYRALVVLETKGTTRVAALADALEVSPSTATRLCDRLVAKALVRRRRSIDDRREVRIELAPLGQALVEKITERRLVAIRAVLEAVDPACYPAMLVGFGEFGQAVAVAPHQDWSEALTH
jgi:DNA-binding MarR family transcriptional regulator